VALATAIFHPDKVQSLILAATTPAWEMTEPVDPAKVNAGGPEAIERFMLGILLSPDALDHDPRVSAPGRPPSCRRRAAKHWRGAWPRSPSSTGRRLRRVPRR